MITKEKIDGINEALDRADAPFKAEYRRVAKNNVELDSIMLKSSEMNAVPTFYPTDDILSKSDDEIADVLLDLYKKNARDFDVLGVLTKENILNNIRPRLWSISNKDHLERDDVAMKDFDETDLVITFYVTIEGLTDTDGMASMQITNNILEMCDLTVDEAYAAAVDNVKNDVSISSVFQVLKELMTGELDNLFEEAPVDDSMWVVTNSHKTQGAGCILSKDVLAQLAERMNVKSFYILPSSVHEVIAIPASSTDDVDALASMVKEINRTEVDPQERLTDSVYLYENGVLSQVA